MGHTLNFVRENQHKIILTSVLVFSAVYNSEQRQLCLDKIVIPWSEKMTLGIFVPFCPWHQIWRKWYIIHRWLNYNFINYILIYIMICTQRQRVLNDMGRYYFKAHNKSLLRGRVFKLLGYYSQSRYLVHALLKTLS